MSSTSDRVDESTGSLDNYVLKMLSQPLGGIRVGLFHYGLCHDDSTSPLNMPHGSSKVSHMLGGCSLLTTKFLWFTGAIAKAREEARGTGASPSIVYVRLQSSSATLKCLQKDKKEPKRPRPCMELITGSSNQVVSASSESSFEEMAVLETEGFTTMSAEDGDSNEEVALVTAEGPVDHLPSLLLKGELA
ncbi:hypothetical protein Patl1_15344 [Pistacia atlantica]|uniref:Uncharacterized protein n=1 Tax=Pistacia atlantica TaxID=434234 RepID=A0ACC1B646_9ROSI|nr:hypothetical protein Patl1_15344 [Pistacia atlantica]